MHRWLISLILLTGVTIVDTASAKSTLVDLLTNKQNITPLKLIEKVEKQYNQVVVEFDIDVYNGKLVYEINAVNTKDNTITEFEFLVKEGKLIRQQVESLEADKKDKLKAVQLIIDKGVSFSKLIAQAMGDDNDNAHIIEAQLDHDLGISYIELKTIDSDGKHKFAFDIKNLQPLPLLR